MKTTTAIVGLTVIGALVGMALGLAFGTTGIILALIVGLLIGNIGMKLFFLSRWYKP